MAASGFTDRFGAGNVTTTAPAPRLPISDDARLARDRLLRKIAAEADLPALGSSVARVVQLASSDDDSVRELAHFLLSDVALTQKILRLSNTVCYRTASGVPVTTISRAIFLLGFDTVKTSALAMLLVEGMKGKHAASVRTELGFALSASVIGREMARRSPFRDAEEAAVAALFKNMGRLLVAAHDHRLYVEIAALSEGGSVSPLQASMLKTARNRQEWLQQVAAFSTTAAALIPTMTQPGEDAASRALLTRFGSALNLDTGRLTELLATVAQETRVLTENADLLFAPEVADVDVESDVALRETGDAQADAASTAQLEDASGLPMELFMIGAPDDAQDGCHPSGKPLRAREMLLAGVQDVTEMMASGRCKTNDLILLALETLYRSMGFRFATVCLRDVKTNQFRSRIALGKDSARLQEGFAFAASNQRDLFNLAMQNDADLMIADASSARIAPLIPAWHRNLMPEASSFIVLPLVVQKVPFGFFYADRICPAAEGVPPDETALIKTLKGQVIAALSAR
jgi:HD-like signal output (HDOD) protein